MKYLAVTKMFLFSFIIISCTMWCSAENSAANSSTAPKDTLLKLTISDLAKYDGKDGHKAYIAVDSVIYDVSASKAWKNGEHKMGIKAGLDHSQKILQSPHGKKVLKKLPIVGHLIPTISTTAPSVPSSTKSSIK